MTEKYLVNGTITAQYFTDQTVRILKNKNNEQNESVANSDEFNYAITLLICSEGCLILFIQKSNLFSLLLTLKCNIKNSRQTKRHYIKNYL